MSRKNHLRMYARMVIFVTLLCGLHVGCKPAPPPKAVPLPVAQKKDDADNPLVKEARPETEAVLKELLAGKYDNDPNLFPIARKVKGFQSWSIETQQINPDLPKAINFSGTLKGPNGEATFTVLMVKQENGKWMIATFQGPNAR